MPRYLEPRHERERLADRRELESQQRLRRESLELSFAYVALGAVGLFAAAELVRYLVVG